MADDTPAHDPLSLTVDEHSSLGPPRKHMGIEAEAKLFKGPFMSDHVRQLRQRVMSAVDAYKNDERIPPDFTKTELYAAINTLAVDADTNLTMYQAWRKRAEEAEKTRDG